MRDLAKRLILLFGLLGLAWAGPASASLRVDPFVVYIIPNTPSMSSVVQLTNVTDVQLPFEVTVVKRTVVDGREVDVPADDDFVIFPPQMIIRAGETQSGDNFSNRFHVHYLALSGGGGDGAFGAGLLNGWTAAGTRQGNEPLQLE